MPPAKTFLYYLQEVRVSPESCIRHGECEAEAYSPLEGRVNGIWLVCDQHHNADVDLKVMQQHTYSAWLQILCAQHVFTMSNMHAWVTDDNEKVSVAEFERP